MGGVCVVCVVCGVCVVSDERCEKHEARALRQNAVHTTHMHTCKPRARVLLAVRRALPFSALRAACFALRAARQTDPSRCEKHKREAQKCG